MIIERVELSVTSGREGDFEAAMQPGCALLAAAHGCLSVALARGIERPSHYLLMLQWQSIEDHTAFTTTDDFRKFREIVAPFVADRPSMEHFQPVIGAG